MVCEFLNFDVDDLPSTNWREISQDVHKLAQPRVRVLWQIRKLNNRTEPKKKPKQRNRNRNKLSSGPKREMMKLKISSLKGISEFDKKNYSRIDFYWPNFFVTKILFCVTRDFEWCNFYNTLFVIDFGVLDLLEVSIIKP